MRYNSNIIIKNVAKSYDKSLYARTVAASKPEGLFSCIIVAIVYPISPVILPLCLLKTFGYVVQKFSGNRE
jgi:hypothetical protein